MVVKSHDLTMYLEVFISIFIKDADFMEKIVAIDNAFSFITDPKVRAYRRYNVTTRRR